MAVFLAACSSADPSSGAASGPPDLAGGREVAAAPSAAIPGSSEDVESDQIDGPRHPEGSDGYTIVATGSAADVVARADADPDAEVVARFANPGTNGLPPVFQVVGPIDGPWLQVLLPIRPNGSTGWLRSSDVDLARNLYRIVIVTEEHRLVVYRNDDIVVDTEVAIGTGATPTPLGSFYLTELLQPPDPSGPYGTYAFGLSGFSETLRSFNGGDGVIGIHGTNDPDALGTDVSHGCIRVANETIDEMASFLPLGTPVSITRQPSGS